MTQRRKRQRHRILVCAARLIARRGYEAVSLGDIAREARLTRTAVYYYFPSKEALIRHLRTLGWRVLYRAIRPYRTLIEADPESALTGIVQAEYDTFVRYRSLMRCLFRLQEYPESPSTLDNVWHRYQQNYLAVHRYLIETGVRQGCFRAVEVQTALRALHGMIWGLLKQGKPSESMRDLLVKEVRRFLLKKP